MLLICKMIIIYLFLLGLLNCQKYHIVHRGPCLRKGESFCQTQVPNSVCSPKTDECFCMNGYVSIKEFNRIVCKTLLTDIVCREDSHCKHVQDSVCHPGAMRCTCPAETIYVQQLQACVTRYVGHSSEHCDKCKALGGDCYINESSKSPDAVQCSCPNNRANTFSSEKVRHHNGICAGLAVDIGGYCDKDRFVCKSKRAQCQRSNSVLPLCQCPETHVPVYQDQLGYYECYPKVDFDVSMSCKLCRLKEGECFRREGDGLRYGCRCSNLISNIFDKEKKADGPNSAKSCVSKFVSVSCWSNAVKICFSPHTYEIQKRLTSGQSLIYVGSMESQNQTSDQCNLKRSSNSKDDVAFCANIRIDITKPELPCGIKSIRYLDGLLFQGQVNLWYSRLYGDVVKDLQIDFSCKNQRYHFKEMTGTIIDRSNKILPYIQYSKERNVRFQIKNIYGDATKYVKKDDVLFMEVELTSNPDEFQSISVEKCSLEAETNHSNTSRIVLDISSSSECKDGKNEIFHKLSWNDIPYMRPLKMKSEFFTFHSLNIKPDSPILISCAMVICKESSACVQANKCNADYSGIATSNYPVMKSNTSLDILVVTSTATLTFGTDAVNQFPNTTKKKFCEDSLCLTDTQMWLISFFCLICIISLTFFIIYLWKKIKLDSNVHSHKNSPDILAQNRNFRVTDAAEKPVSSPCPIQLEKYKNYSGNLTTLPNNMYVTETLNSLVIPNSPGKRFTKESNIDVFDTIDRHRKSFVNLTDHRNCVTDMSCGNLVCQCYDVT